MLTREGVTSERDPAATEPHRVFISYSRVDFYFAEQLAVALRRHGFDVWFDVHELAMGSDWSAAIDEAIVACDTFVLVASRSSLVSPNVHNERDRAAELGRPAVAVLPTRRRSTKHLGLPTYDLTSSFTRGVDRLSEDLTSGQTTGWRPRPRLPYAGWVCVVVAALAFSVVFAVTLAAAFATAVVGHVVPGVQNSRLLYAVAAFAIATVVGWPTYLLWRFLTRRVTWRSLRSGLLFLPLMAVVTYASVGTVATHITTDPLITALAGGSEDNLAVLGSLPALALVAAALTCLVVAIAMGRSAGVYRFLRTGAAPRRLRARYVGLLPSPPEDAVPVRSYRLFATDVDASVAREIRRSLTSAEIHEAAGDEESDRDIFVLTDQTPAEWLTRPGLQRPVAVVGTSISLPVQGLLERFQWVDYRARRRRTLDSLGRDLAAAGPSVPDRATPDVPERLQQVRLPPWVTVTEWMLLCMAVLALVVAAYPIERRVFTDHDAEIWPLVVCFAVAPVLVLGGVWVRRRRIAPVALVVIVGFGWLVMGACGLNVVLHTMYPGRESGVYRWPVLGYAVMSALVIALSWRTLRRWLPRRLRWTAGTAPTLGFARGSWPWWVVLAPALVGAAAAAGITTKEPAPTTPDPAEVAVETCQDRAAMTAIQKPLGEAIIEVNSTKAPDRYRRAFQKMIQAKLDLVSALERFEPEGDWGADMKRRLIAGYDEEVRADQAYFRGQMTVPTWQAAYEPLHRTAVDYAAPLCL